MNPLVSLVLRKNTSPSRIIGFVLSNFIGLTIVAGALQFYADSRSLWSDEDSFVSSDYLVVNKHVSSADMISGEQNAFSEAEIAELEKQPWVRRVGKFEKAHFRVHAGIVNPSGKGGSLSTAMFFESIPDEFLDVKVPGWDWTPESPEVPVIISRDYLALYNFGFASSAGMPQLSESVISGLPLNLHLSSDAVGRMDGNEGDTEKKLSLGYVGRIAGYSSRFNTILVPRSFMDSMNAYFSPQSAESSSEALPSRLIVDVSSPGDTAIAPWLESHGYEIAGDKTASSASFLLRLTVGIVAAVGALITLLSLFILMLSISLLMEKNRSKLHSLLMLGYPLKTVAAPYRYIVTVSSAGAALLSFGAVTLLRVCYLEPLTALGARTAGLWVAVSVIVVMTTLIILLNFAAVWRRVVSSQRI